MSRHSRQQALPLLKLSCLGRLRILRRLELQVDKILGHLQPLLLAGDEVLLQQRFGLQQVLIPSTSVQSADELHVGVCALAGRGVLLCAQFVQLVAHDLAILVHAPPFLVVTDDLKQQVSTYRTNHRHKATLHLSLHVVKPQKEHLHLGSAVPRSSNAAPSPPRSS